MEPQQAQEKLEWKKIAEDLKLRIHNIEISLALSKVQLVEAESHLSKK